MELKLGFMKTSELAQWRGVTTSVWKLYIKKYLEELKDFCDYIQVYGGVRILDIIHPVYERFLADKEMDEALYRRYMATECKNGLTSISGMAAYWINHSDVYDNLSDRTVQSRLSAAGKKLYGDTRNNTVLIRNYETPVCGEIGYRYYMWAVKLDGEGHYREMTDEERKVFCDLCKSASKNMYDELIVMPKKKEKVEKVVEKYKNGFVKILNKFKEKTDSTLVRASMHINENGEKVFEEIYEI